MHKVRKISRNSYGQALICTDDITRRKVMYLHNSCHRHLTDPGLDLVMGLFLLLGVI